MKNITKQFKWASGLVALLLAGQVQAAVIMSGSAAFSETGGLWSGTLFGEVSGTAGNYTSIFSIIMDADSDASASLIRDITLDAWALGGATPGGTGATGGSAGDPNYVDLAPGFFGKAARFDFDFPGLAEGATSASFWFTHDNLTLAGDSIGFGLSDFANNSASPFTLTMAPVVIPLPAAIWLFGSGLLGLAGIIRRKQS